MGRLTTHVLDTSRGIPGAGIRIELYSLRGRRRLVRTAETDRDGRTEAPLLEGEGFTAGVWELVFFVGHYFEATGVELSEPPFLDQVVVRFGISARQAHYHVPLLVSPWGYTTYRGS